MSKGSLIHHIYLWLAIVYLNVPIGCAWVENLRLCGGISIGTLPPAKQGFVLQSSSDNGDKGLASNFELETESVDTSSAPQTSNGSTSESEREQLQQKQVERQMSSREIMNALGTSPRRILLSVLSASAIALGGNFLGVTSWVETLFPEDVIEATGLDTYFPRGI